MNCKIFLFFYFRKLRFEDRAIDSMFTALNNKKEQYVANGIEMLMDEKKQIVAVFTPKMKRSREMDFAGDVNFVDSR